MMKQKTIQSISRSSSSSSSGSSISGSSSRSSSSSSSSSGSIEASKTHEISDEAELGEYSDGKWRILMSNKLGRPFFYNSETKIGQFSIPEEFTTTSAQEEEEHTSLVELQDDPESVPTAAKVFDLSTSDSPKNTNDVEFQAVYSKKAKIEKRTSSSIPQEDSQNRKEDSQDPINTSGQQSHEKNSRAIIDSDRSNDQQGCVESEEIMCIPEDSCSENFENIMPVCEKTEEEIPFDHTQIDSQIGFYESNLSTTVLNGGGDDDGDGDGDVLNEKKWACTACTFENNNEVFSCAMCGHPSGLSKLRRSQRDSHVNTGSGSIMHGFSLSQNHGLGSTQTQQTQSSTDLGIFPTPRGNTNNLSNRRLSSTTSIISHGSSSKSQQNNRKKR